jgi:uncharacterized NAD(P)/FAD-binding protein YdhS
MHISITGGGAVGAGALISLADHLMHYQVRRPFEVTLIEKSAEFGQGLAYGTDVMTHLLNMPSGTMSIRRHNKMDFVEWLNDGDNHQADDADISNYTAESFVPRKIFGSYIFKRLRQAVVSLENMGGSISLLNNTEAVSMSRSGNAWQIALAGGSNVTSDYAFLCPGNQPSQKFPHLRSNENYISDAWPATKVAKDDVVYIIGSSLTAIDVLKTLKANGHEGKIYFLSRRGYLPRVRYAANKWVLSELHPANPANDSSVTLKAFRKKYLEELSRRSSELQPYAELRRIKRNSIRDTLEQDIALAEAANSPFFDVLKALDEVVSELWNRLPDGDKIEFEHRYRSIWNAYSYAMPIDTAKVVLSCMEFDQLEVLGGFKDIEFDAKQQKFIAFDASGLPLQIESGGVVINATGPSQDLQSVQNPLLRQMYQDGLLSTHSAGGVNVDFETCQTINAEHQINENLYLIGSLTRGVHFYTNSLEQNLTCMNRAINHMIRHAGLAIKPGPAATTAYSCVPPTI